MDTSSEKEKSAQSLCTSCGLCCDGSIFDHAVIILEDDGVSLEKGGFTVRQRGERRSFLLPCHHLHGRKCDIYYSWRPCICSGFICKVLKQFEKGEISFGQGMEIIEKALRHLAELRRQIQPAGTARSMNISEMFKLWKNERENPDAAVMLNFVSLQLRLSRDFGKGEKTGAQGK